MRWWLSYKSAFVKYADFQGRTPPGVFWRFTLINYLVWWVASFAAAGVARFAPVELALVVALAYPVAALLPTLAITARRLHDVGDHGRTGWWQLLYIIFPLGLFIVWIMCAAGSGRPNRWGQPPLPKEIQ